MNKSQRIYLNTGNTGNQNEDKFITVKLEQDVETLEFMSMTLRTKDVYQNFNADYGVLVGRVLANGGVGVENAKVSIFIPITDEDADNPDIYKLYPYTTPRDKNTEGKRYNLLPRVSKRDPEDGEIKPKQAFGSFPIKEEIVTNTTFLEVYKKYYKYTTTTNRAGDYMIFGVPVGTQTVHMSCDITDIGRYSMNAASMVVNLGYPESSFTNQNTRIKETSDLTDLPHIETQEISMDIRPFWGDAENFEIGITRQDFRIRAVLTNTFTLFGTSFTDSADTMRGTKSDDLTREIRDFYYIYPNIFDETAENNDYGVALANKRVAEITEKIYYYPADITDSEIDINTGSADPVEDMQILEKSQYSVYKRNGDFVFIINCNRRKVITDDEGDEVVVDNDNPNGVFTEFRGFVTLEYEETEAPMTNTSSITNNENTKTAPLRLRFKFPQHANQNNSFDYTNGSTTTTWRKEHQKFEAKKFYSFSKFHGCVSNDEGTDGSQFPLDKKFFDGDELNCGSGFHTDGNWKNRLYNIGVIRTGTANGYSNSDYQMPNNSWTYFGANWLNLCVYFPQIGYSVSPFQRIRGVRTSSFLATQWENEDARNRFFIENNDMPIAAGQFNTKWFGRSDLHWTDIVEVPLVDIKEMRSWTQKGFTDLQVSGLDLSKYRNGDTKPSPTPWKGTWTTECPFNGGKVNALPSSGKDSRFYFYKGFGEADCIDFLYRLGLVT